MAIHGLTTDEIDEFLAAIRVVGEWIDSESDDAEAIVSADPDDDPIVQLTLIGKAEVLCTLDRHLRSDEIRSYCHSHCVRILTDRESLEEFRAAENA
jgi:predicted nucleic acid-binding protein